MLSHKPSIQAGGWFSQSGPDADVVLSSRVNVSRNISGFAFPHRLEASAALEVRKRIESAVAESEEQFVALDRAALSRAAVRFYEERGIFSTVPGELVYLSPDESRLLRTGGRDHLRIETLAPGFALSEALERTVALDRELENRLHFAVSLQLGYLTADIDQCGSALTAGALLDLGALHRDESAVPWAAEAEERGIEVHPFGLGERSYGSLVVLRAASRAGERDEAVVTRLAEFVGALVHYEREARVRLLSAAGHELREAAYRAYGTMRHAQRITLEELDTWLAVLRLAVGCGIADIVTLEQVTQLIFVTQPAHVALLSDAGSDEAQRRAHVVHAVLGGA